MQKKKKKECAEAQEILLFCWILCILLFPFSFPNIYFSLQRVSIQATNSKNWGKKNTLGRQEFLAKPHSWLQALCTLWGAFGLETKFWKASQLQRTLSMPCHYQKNLVNVNVNFFHVKAFWIQVFFTFKNLLYKTPQRCCAFVCKRPQQCCPFFCKDPNSDAHSSVFIFCPLASTKREFCDVFWILFVNLESLHVFSEFTFHKVFLAVT